MRSADPTGQERRRCTSPVLAIHHTSPGFRRFVEDPDDLALSSIIIGLRCISVCQHQQRPWYIWALRSGQGSHPGRRLRGVEPISAFPDFTGSWVICKASSFEQAFAKCLRDIAVENGLFGMFNAKSRRSTDLYLESDEGASTSLLIPTP